ncbi:hypothetical protein HY988_05710 [Candidatus Micrarchaeota archaeon]|nr:hypothetical protein [Candidatus Micrarchaeota archaeon]
MVKSITACPKCKRPVEAKDYVSPAIAGFKSILPTINCSCSYYGLPLTFSKEDYEKWIKE